MSGNNAKNIFLFMFFLQGYVTMGAVPPGHWSQQAFAAQTPLAFGVQSPLGPVAQVLPGGQPLIWGQANIFPATQQQWAAMAAGAFPPTAYLPAQPVGTLFQTLTPVTTVTPASESHPGAGAANSAASSSALASPQDEERSKKMGKEMFKVTVQGGCCVVNVCHNVCLQFYVKLLIKKALGQILWFSLQF